MSVIFKILGIVVITYDLCDQLGRIQKFNPKSKFNFQKLNFIIICWYKLESQVDKWSIMMQQQCSRRQCIKYYITENKTDDNSKKTVDFR